MAINSAAVPYNLITNRPTSPAVLYQFGKGCLVLQKLDINVEFHVSTAFVNIQGTWQNHDVEADCLFALPLLGTVTNVVVRAGASRIVESMIIPNEEAEKLRGKPNEDPDPGIDTVAGEIPYDQYIPNLFRFPITKVQPNETLQIEANYIEPLAFSSAHYHFALPLTFEPGTAVSDQDISDIVHIQCKIHAISKDTKCESSSHHLDTYCDYPVITLNTTGEFDAQTDPNDVRGRDFTLSYSMMADSIFGTLIIQEEEQKQIKKRKKAQMKEGSFVLFVSPPQIKPEGVLPRNIVFLLDRSGSMIGDPFNEAIRALQTLIDSLNPNDKFSIISFDHRQVSFNKLLVHANPSNKNSSKHWIQTFQPERGGTDIKTPLASALGILDVESQDVLANSAMNFVFLITDGCVAGEREICRIASQHCKKTRILTLGIGTYCNWFFLKMLSQIARGFSDVVVYKEDIFDKVVGLLEKASEPILTDIDLHIGGLKECAISPFPLPDLFISSPLTISGKWKGDFPDSVTLQGMDFDGNVHRLDIKSKKESRIPVSKILLRQFLDLQTARAWLDESKEIEQEVIDTSIEHSMPSAYTMMVGVESFAEEEKENDNIGKGILQRTKKNRVKIVLAAAAIGGAFLVGAAAFSFGDLGASLANSPAVGDFGAASGDGDCCDCDDCCGDDCDCSDCLVC